MSKKNIFIVPAIGEDDLKGFEVQCLKFDNGNNNCIITGNVHDSIAELVYISLSIIRGNDIYFNLNNENLNNFDYHIHYTDTDIFKEGSSAGVATFLSIANSIKKIRGNLKIYATGEIDIYGNIHEVGGIKEKIEFFNKIDADIFFIPNCSISFKEQQRIKKVSNVFEILSVLNNGG